MGKQLLGELELNRIYQQDCIEGMRMIPDSSIDLTVTSPPYDNLRIYKGYSFDFETTAREIFRVTKPGGVLVWIVSDATVNGSETGTSFRQALYFKEIGFRLNDTMIWSKGTFRFPHKIRYRDSFEYMFIFTKGKPKTVNLINDRKNKYAGTTIHGTFRDIDGSTKVKSGSMKGTIIEEYGVRFNIWEIPNPGRAGNKHPATFPEKLANDHIISWSNVGDIILDPFIGSGTTAKMAVLNSRNWIGFEVSSEYVEIANKRLASLQEAM